MLVTSPAPLCMAWLQIEGASSPGDAEQLVTAVRMEEDGGGWT